MGISADDDEPRSETYHNFPAEFTVPIIAAHRIGQFRRFRPRHMLTINHVAGLIIGILGIYTILSTFFDIFPNVH